MLNVPFGDAFAFRMNAGMIDNDGIVDYPNVYQLDSNGDPVVNGDVVTALPVYHRLTDVDTVDIKYARGSPALRAERDISGPAFVPVAEGRSRRPPAGDQRRQPGHWRHLRRLRVRRHPARAVGARSQADLARTGNGLRVRDAHVRHLVLRPHRHGHQRQLGRVCAQWLVRVLRQFAAADGAGRAVLRRIGIRAGIPARVEGRRVHRLDRGHLLHGPGLRPRAEQLPRRLPAVPECASTCTGSRRTRRTRTSCSAATRPTRRSRCSARSRSISRTTCTSRSAAATSTTRCDVDALVDIPIWKGTDYEAPPGVAAKTISDNDFLFKANLAWDVTDDSMLYATYSQGYRHAGANAVPTSGKYGENPDFFTFDADTVDNFEVGYKGVIGLPVVLGVGVLHRLAGPAAQYARPRTGASSPRSTATRPARRASSSNCRGAITNILNYSLGYTYADSELTADV